MNSTIGAASVARLAAIALAVLLVVGLAATPDSAQPARAEPTRSRVGLSHPVTARYLLPTAAGSSSTIAIPTRVPAPVAGAPLVVSPILFVTGIPTTAQDAYHRAADAMAARRPQCGIPWYLLAGIGRVESDHGQYGGAVLYANGLSSKPIIGLPLNGNGVALIRDTDHGYYDHDTVYDHAVGPMQFIPSTWARDGADGNGDHVRDPFNIYDAALAAAGYLCTAGGDLRTLPGEIRAVFAYNHLASYVAEVLALAAAYAAGHSGALIPVVAAPPGSTPPARPPTGSPSPTRSPSATPSCPPSSPSSSPSPTPSGSSTSSNSATPSPTPGPTSGTPSGSPTSSSSSSPSPSPSSSPSPSPTCG